MASMSATQDPASATAMVVERGVVAEHLLDEQTKIEPVVVLDSAAEGARVRKLTVAEKLAHSERAGTSTFLADEHEQEQFFALLDRREDAE